MPAVALRRGNAAIEPSMLAREFYARPPLRCARDLLGCRLQWDGCGALIVETEAYDATGDPACHTFRRPSARQFVANHPPGSAYVYFNYGMHWLFNVLVKGGARQGFVLIRAVEPLLGIETMLGRSGRRALHLLGSGPGRLTRALAITGRHHGADLCANPHRTILGRTGGRISIECSPRIGISLAKDYPWRFSIRDNRHVSPGRPQPKRLLKSS